MVLIGLLSKQKHWLFFWGGGWGGTIAVAHIYEHINSFVFWQQMSTKHVFTFWIDNKKLTPKARNEKITKYYSPMCLYLCLVPIVPSNYCNPNDWTPHEGRDGTNESEFEHSYLDNYSLQTMLWLQNLAPTDLPGLETRLFQELNSHNKKKTTCTCLSVQE